MKDLQGKDCRLMNDNDIVELYLMRKETAIAETEGKYGIYCKTIAKNILGSEEDSEECVSDTWLKAWNSIPPAKPLRLGLFLGRITRNLAIDRYRAKSAGKRGHNETALCLEELEECVGGGDSIADTVALKDSVNRFLNRLKPREREIFMLRYMYMFSISRIGARLGIKEGTVKMSLSRSRIKLRDFLKKEGYDI